MKARIVERTAPDGRKTYVIQQRHAWFRWWWVDAWVNSSCGAACQDSFSTLEEAQRNLCWFDGTPCTDRVMPKGKDSMNKAFQEWSDAEDRELIDRMMPSTSAEIETAIRVVQRINYGAAFGHDPELCRATSKTLNALRTANDPA